MSDLADRLTEVWDRQDRDGFLLTSADDPSIEVRRLHDPESGVDFRLRWMPHRELRTDVRVLEERGIVAPQRVEASLYRDPRDPSGRYCFLCPGNIRTCNPKEELVPIDLSGRAFYAGANFAWISRHHFTVMAADHVDQSFAGRELAEMLSLHAATGGAFRVIYNGPYAGATIPWHLHYQVTSEPFPIEDLPPGGEHRYPTAVSRFAQGEADEAVALAEEWHGRDEQNHRVNVLVAGPPGSATVHVFARDTRRSHSAVKGLMGGFEVCGDLVYSEPDKRGVFETADVALVRRALAEIRPSGI